MTIIFGTYSFVIKRYTPEDLGIKPPDGNTFEIQVRQRVFHLFYIPVFPIEKLKALKMEDKLYDLPWDYERAVIRKGEPRISILSFTLPILVLCFFGYRMIDRKLELQRRAHNKLERFNNRIANLDSSLADAGPDHYILLTSINSFEDNWENKGTYLKITETSSDSLKYIAVHVDKDLNSIRPYHLLTMFQERAGRLDTFSIARNTMSQAIPRKGEPDKFSTYQPFGVDFFGDDKLLVINRINYFRGPVISASCSSYGGPEKVIKFRITNLGSPALFTEVVNVKGDIIWSTELPVQVNTNRQGSSNRERIQLEGTGYQRGTSYEFIFKFIDGSGEEHKFKVEGVDGTSTVRRLLD